MPCALIRKICRFWTGQQSRAHATNAGAESDAEFRSTCLVPCTIGALNAFIAHCKMAACKLDQCQHRQAHSSMADAGGFTSPPDSTAADSSEPGQDAQAGFSAEQVTHLVVADIQPAEAGPLVVDPATTKVALQVMQHCTMFAPLVHPGGVWAALLLMKLSAVCCSETWAFMPRRGTWKLTQLQTQSKSGLRSAVLCRRGPATASSQ